MAIPQLGAFPSPPLLGQTQSVFNTNASNTLSYMSTWVTEMNAVSSAIDSATSAIDATEANVIALAQSVESISNNKGAWSNLTGALNIPASVSHTNSIWILNVNLANVALSEPTAINTDWTEVSGVTQAELDLKLDITEIGVSVQAYDADTAKLDVAQSYTAPQSGTEVSEDLAIDLSAGNNFIVSGTGTMSFSGGTNGQSGNILLTSTGTISDGGFACDANFLTTISTAGTYWLSYIVSGGVVYVTTSGALS